jgi:S1-C subfamily serine protease
MTQAEAVVNLETTHTSGGHRRPALAIVIGSPLDFRNSVTVGIVSGLERTLDTGSGVVAAVAKTLTGK